MIGNEYAARKRPRNRAALWHIGLRRVKLPLYDGYSTSDA